MERIIEFFKRNYYLAAGPLLFFSGPTFDVWIFKAFPFIAWFALVPLFYYIREKPLKEVYLSTFFTGIIACFFNFEWIGNFAGKHAGGYATIVAFLIPSMAVFFTLKIFIAEGISRIFPRLRILAFSLIWVLFDWIQSIGYLAFPWSNIAYSQYPVTPMIQVTALIGTLGLNFIMIMWQSLLTETIRVRMTEKLSLAEMAKQAHGRAVIIFLFLVIVNITAGGIYLAAKNAPVEKDLRVSIVQSCISPWENWRQNRFRYLRELKRLTEVSLFEDPDMVIWSESATLETISFNYFRGRLNRFQEELLQYVKYIGRPLITGEIGIEKVPGFMPRYYPQNNAVFIGAGGEVKKTYAKIHLVPFGEWFPYEKLPLIGPFVKNVTTSYGGSSFVPGTRPELFEFKGRKFGVLVCYEGIFYRLCRKYRELGVDFLVNITNDGWTDKYRGHMQHFAASVFRAVENGVWYIRAGNTGYTTIIDPLGRIRHSMPILKKGHVAGNLDFSHNRRTFYTASGDIFQYILTGGAFFLLALTLLRLLQTRLKRTSS